MEREILVSQRPHMRPDLGWNCNLAPSSPTPRVSTCSLGLLAMPGPQPLQHHLDREGPPHPIWGPRQRRLQRVP